jgi:subtilisin-like proprotein convertase family protein
VTAAVRSHLARRSLALAALVLAACGGDAVTPPPGARAALVVSVTALQTTEGSAATFDVTLGSRPSAPVDVEVRSENPNEGLVLPPGYAMPAAVREVTFTPADWDRPRTVAVHAVDDRWPDGSVEYSVALRVAYTDDAEYGAAPMVHVRVTNSDAPPPVAEPWTEWPSGDVPKAIPDLGTITSVLQVAGGPSWISDVSVSLTLAHTWERDLVITLVAPWGAEVTLADRVGGSGGGFTATVFDDAAMTPIVLGSPPFTGSYRPAAPLSALRGQNANGTWTLRVQDVVSPDVGTLWSWTVMLR